MKKLFLYILFIFYLETLLSFLQMKLTVRMEFDRDYKCN
jgi:hypothetical protein